MWRSLNYMIGLYCKIFGLVVHTLENLKLISKFKNSGLVIHKPEFIKFINKMWPEL